MNHIADTCNQIEQIEPLDGLYSKTWMIHISQVFHWQMTMKMKRSWSHEKIHNSNQVQRHNDEKLLFVFQQQTTLQHLQIERLLLKKLQRINIWQLDIQWVQQIEQHTISRRLQLIKTTQWLMCKLIQSRRRSIGSQIQIRLRGICWTM